MGTANRRELLGALGAVSIVGLAGCQTGQSSGTDHPPVDIKTPTPLPTPSDIPSSEETTNTPSQEEEKTTTDTPKQGEEGNRPEDKMEQDLEALARALGELDPAIVEDIDLRDANNRSPFPPAKTTRSPDTEENPEKLARYYITEDLTQRLHESAGNSFEVAGHLLEPWHISLIGKGGITVSMYDLTEAGIEDPSKLLEPAVSNLWPDTGKFVDFNFQSVNADIEAELTLDSLYQELVGEGSLELPVFITDQEKLEVEQGETEAPAISNEYGILTRNPEEVYDTSLFFDHLLYHLGSRGVKLPGTAEREGVMSINPERELPSDPEELEFGELSKLQMYRSVPVINAYFEEELVFEVRYRDAPEGEHLRDTQLTHVEHVVEDVAGFDLDERGYNMEDIVEGFETEKGASTLYVMAPDDEGYRIGIAADPDGSFIHAVYGFRGENRGEGTSYAL